MASGDSHLIGLLRNEQAGSVQGGQDGVRGQRGHRWTFPHEIPETTEITRLEVHGPRPRFSSAPAQTKGALGTTHTLLPFVYSLSLLLTS